MRWLLPIFGFIIAIYLALTSGPSQDLESSIAPEQENSLLTPKPSSSHSKTPPADESGKRKISIQTPVVSSSTPSKTLGKKEDKKNKATVLNYRIDDGIATVLGDIAVGVLKDEGAANTGLVEFASIQTWDSPIIPFIIDPNVSNSQEILQALAMFNSQTVLEFIEYSGEDDALVFTKTDGVSKSYVGKVGGLQPVWIAADAAASTVAHEIMHALGFIHEQNRSDRDQFIHVQMDNIENEYKHNFDILPGEYMKLSGLSSFDFESVMIYPPWMFAKGGHSTMDPKVKNVLIHPSSSLSRLDIQRINRVFGHRAFGL